MFPIPMAPASDTTPGGGHAVPLDGRPPISVMVIEDDIADRMLVRRILKRADTDYQVSEFATASDALVELPRVRPQCVLLDLNLPDMNGMAFLDRLRELDVAEMPCVVVLTGDDTRGLGVKALKAGASDFIVKDELDAATLERAVHIAVNELKARRLRLQLERTEKLAALGQLAAGVAHEVNNPATFMTVNLDLITMKLGTRETRGPIALDVEAATEVREMLSDCRDGIRQISAIVEELRAQTLSRMNGVKLLCLDELVTAAQRLLKPQLSSADRLDVELSAAQPFAGDRVKLTQVVSNLLLNAAHAAGTGGTIRVRTWMDDGAAVLDVEDDGPGVPEAMRARVFEPFFTTKKGKKGMGLGLALCASYVQQHAGEITIGDAAIGGALFRVRLPLENGLRLSADGPNRTLTPIVKGRRPRLLVIDDEPGILKAYERVLAPDFELRLESDPLRALKLLQSERFDGVISELVLSGLDGPTLYQKVRQEAGQGPFVFCTGATPDDETEALLESEGVEVLTKPIDFTRLRAVLPRSSTDI